MTRHKKSKNNHLLISRRSALATGGVCFAMMGHRAFATMPAGAVASAGKPKSTFTIESESDGTVEIAGIHQGKGTGKTKLFRFGDAPWPAHFMIYDLPPGASEGVHVHFLDDRNGEGPFDEYYYIMSGEGQMEIDGEIVPVAKGDHIHTPLEMAHGVENTHPSENLRVFLTFIERHK